MKVRWFLIITLLVLCMGFLSAKQEVTITSSYITEPFLQFNYGPPPVLAGYNSADTKIYPSNLCALLGTLTLETDGNNLFDPALIHINVSTNTYIQGYVKDPGTGQIVYADAIPVTLRAISVTKKGISSVIVENGSIDLVPDSNGNVLGNASSMPIYIVIIAPDMGYNYYIPGVVYSLGENSTIGSFGVSAVGQGQEPFVDIPVEVDHSGAPTTDAPFIPGATAPGSDLDIPFGGGGFEFDHYYVFSIINNPAEFDIYQAISGIHQTVATAQLQVLEAQPSTEYGVEIAFSSKDPTGFKLHLNDDLSEYAIPYQLFYGQNNTPIPHAQFIIWDGLISNTNTNASATMEKTITVLVNDGSEASGAPQGHYSDTVTVNIIPLDTIP